MIRYLLITGVALLFGATAQAKTLEVGEAKAFKTPSAAAAIAQDGDVVTIEAGSYFDCAVWSANRLVIQGVGDPAKVVITDKACQGKALFITAGNDITVRNLTLARARVPDANGAGIRAEGQNLVVDHVIFVNNQNGIMSGTKGGTMTVRDSTFDRNGACITSCAHGLYVGGLDLLRIERSHFIATKAAHHIKSRALRTEIIGCTIEDGPEGTASYAIEIPNGGGLLVQGNTIQKGPKADNHSAAIVIGAEGVTQPTPELLIVDNSFRNDGGWETAFVNNLTATDAQLRGNRISGAVKPLRGDGTVTPGR